MNVLNKMFDRVYCLNLDDRPDKMQHFQSQADSIGLDFVRVSATIPQQLGLAYVWKNARTACAYSHAKIWEEAIKDGLQSILLLEDDIVICNHFNERFNLSIENLPQDWDIIHFTYNKNGYLYKKNLMQLESVNDSWDRYKKISGAMAVAYSRRALITANKYLNTKNATNLIRFGACKDLYLANDTKLYSELKCYTPTDNYFSYKNIGRSDTTFTDSTKFDVC